MSISQETAQRLMSQKAEKLARERAEGFEFGKRWAEKRADYDDLEAIYELEFDEIEESMDGTDPKEERFAFASAVCSAVDEPRFWEQWWDVWKGRAPQNEFVKGFIEACNEAFEAVEEAESAPANA